MSTYNEPNAPPTSPERSPKKCVLEALEHFAHALDNCRKVLPSEGVRGFLARQLVGHKLQTCLELMRAGVSELSSSIEKDWPENS